MARDIYSLYTNTYNFENKACTDLKYVPNESLKIVLHYHHQETQNQ